MEVSEIINTPTFVYRYTRIFSLDRFACGRATLRTPLNQLSAGVRGASESLGIRGLVAVGATGGSGAYRRLPPRDAARAGARSP